MARLAMPLAIPASFLVSLAMIRFQAVNSNQATGLYRFIVIGLAIESVIVLALFTAFTVWLLDFGVRVSRMKMRSSSKKSDNR